MGNLSRTMSGTPWHVEHYERKEGDERRHKHRCRYYIKSNNFCMKKNEKCMGSAHCMIYDERISDLSTSTTAASDSKPATSINSGKPSPHIFNSIIYVDLSSIHVSNEIKQKAVPKIDFKTARSYFQNNKKLQCPLYVTSSDDSYELTDNYLQYKVAKYEKLQKVPVFIGDYDLYTKYQKAIMNGATIVHSRYGKGTVVKSDYKYIWVEFASNKLIKLDTILCLKNKLIEV